MNSTNDTKHIIPLDESPSLAHAFERRTALTPAALAYQMYRDDAWVRFTWGETRAMVARWQTAMQRDGLQRGDRVAILCSNRWEWVVCDQAAQGLGLVTVPIYTNDRAENMQWILHDAGVRWLLVENDAQWQAMQAIRDELEQLLRIVVLHPVEAPPDNMQHVDEWLDDAVTEYQLVDNQPDDVATIVYTSGTTGKPKGVMLTHRNILWNIHAVFKIIMAYPDDLLLSFLPLSHTLERTAGYYLPIVSGTPVAYSRSIAQLAEDLLTVRPTIMISVPRIFERVYGKIMTKLQTESPLKHWLFETATRLGWQKFEHEQHRDSWHPGLVMQPLLDHLVGGKVREKLGGRLRFTVCGGAALTSPVARLFIGLGIPVLQGYGLTETSPVIAANQLTDNLPKSVGRALPGIEVKLGEHNELLTRSPSVMAGYWNNEAATREIIDSDGWLHTGDQVDIDEHGHITITGRLKEIIVMSNGEKVPPADMENAIALDELVDQVIVIGEGRPYLSALVVPNPEAFERVAEELHIQPANDALVIDDDKVRSLFLEHVQQRIHAFPGYAQIRELAVLREPWTPDNGLITPTLKLRRARILAQYHDVAEKLYAGH